MYRFALSLFVICFLKQALYSQSNPQFLISTVAGAGRPDFPADGTAASSIRFGGPGFVTVDPQGNIYLAETYYRCVVRIAPDGTVATVAGPASAIPLVAPVGVALLPTGELIIADRGANALLKLGLDGTISAILTASPDSVTADSSGNIYFAENNAVRLLDTQGGVQTLVASTQLSRPRGLSADAQGNLYIADSGNNRVVRYTPAGTLEVVAGPDKVAQPNDVLAVNGTVYIADTGNGRVLPANLATPAPSALGFSPTGSLIVVDRLTRQIAIADPASGTITSTYGTPPASPAAGIFDVAAAVADSQGNLYIADAVDQRVRRIAPDGTVSTAAEGLLEPVGLAVDANDNVYIAESVGKRVSKLTPQGALTTFLDKLSAPSGLAFDKAGNLFVAESGANRIQKITPQGAATVVAPNLTSPTGVSIDPNGNLYAAEPDYNRVRIVDSKGVATLFAGTGRNLSAGDGGLAASASLASPRALAVNAYGEILIAEAAGHRVRRVDNTGMIGTMAGTGVPGFAGDGGSSTYAQIDSPSGLWLDASGRVFIADRGNARARRLDQVQLTPQGVQNFASTLPGPISPGEILILDGDGLGPADAVLVQTDDNTGNFPTQAGGTRVLFDGVPAALLFVQSQYVILAAPFSISGKDSVNVSVEVQGTAGNTVNIPVAVASPGIYTRSPIGQGLAIAANSDGSDNSPANPATANSIITFLATGLGDLDPGGTDGFLTPGDQTFVPVQPLTVSIGGQPAVILEAVSQGGQLQGVIRIRAQIPLTAPSGAAVPLILTSGNVASQPGATIAIQ